MRRTTPNDIAPTSCCHDLKMETLPIEMVENVTQYLTPQDLARCCGVSREWRQIFNEDRLWSRHCDPTLEEHLRMTPCVVQPVFEHPEIKDSTLIPISQWRMAFLREKHLKNNWKLKNNREDKVLKLKSEWFIDFLTNNIIVRWCSLQIQLWDLSSVPAVLIAKTDCAPVYPYRPNPSNCLTDGTNIFIVGHAFAEVYHVDVIKKHISFKHQLSFDEGQVDKNWSLFEAVKMLYGQKCIAKDNKFIHINQAGSKLRVFDLGTGKQLKEESYTVAENQNKPGKFVRLISCETSDDVVVVISITELDPTESVVLLPMGENIMPPFICPDKETFRYFIYSPKQLLFLPFKAVSNTIYYDCAINGKFFALRNLHTLTVYNYHTSEVCLTLPGSCCSKVFTFQESFAYKDEETNTLIILFPSDSFVTKLAPHEQRFSFVITNNKYITLTADMPINLIGNENDNQNVYSFQEILSVWKGTGRSLEPSDVIVENGWKINQVATMAVVDSDSISNYLKVFHYW